MKEEALNEYYKNAPCYDIELKPYHDLFVKKVIETHNVLNLEDNDGENHFFDKDIFKEFFTSADLLIGFYAWRTSGFLTDTIDLFEEEFEGWIDECKEMALNTKDILKNIYAKQLADKMYRDNLFEEIINKCDLLKADETISISNFGANGDLTLHICKDCEYNREVDEDYSNLVMISTEQNGKFVDDTGNIYVTDGELWKELERLWDYKDFCYEKDDIERE